MWGPFRPARRAGTSASPYGLRYGPGPASQAWSVTPTSHRTSDRPDCGGSNGNRTRLWKTELQRLADHTGLALTVCHFPPGTSKWNKIEHRLFSYISINWRGKPLTSRQTVIDLIASTTTRTGLKVYARLDPGSYPDKITITDRQLAAVQLEPHSFHPEWNYTIKPRR